MAVFNSLTFDGENSLDYGIYISGEGVYDAPIRAVEMVTIPGRNGTLAIDQGRFENIDVKYAAGAFGSTQAEYAGRMRAFRNMLASRYSYVRLEDNYHPDEFRLGLYKNGLDVKPVSMSRAGEFDIIFDCKPQRFLKSGEIAVTGDDWSDVQSGSGSLVTIENPDEVIDLKSLTVDLEPIQSGSGTPSPTNVRPISGHTEAVTHRTGKNLLNCTLGTFTRAGITFTVNSDGTVVATGTATDLAWVDYGTADLKGGVEYKLNGGVSARHYVVVKGHAAWQSGASDKAFTPPSDMTATIQIVIRAGEQANGEVFKPMIRLATETDSTFEPYKGETYTTALGRTVYGGTLDVVSGVLTVTHAIVDLGTLTWTKAANLYKTYFMTSTEVADMKKSTGNLYIQPILCSNYASESWTHALDNATYDGVICEGWVNKSYIAIADSAKVNLDASAFKTAMNGVQLCYELAEPQIYQLTPQQIELLRTNNIWSDSGDMTVEYGTSPFRNPTEFPAKPLIKTVGTGTIRINGVTIAISESPTTIDCEAMEAYNGTESRNGDIVLTPNEFPTLEPGANFVEAGSGITTLEIIPRWWRL